jgi:hypothetical protein
MAAIHPPSAIDEAAAETKMAGPNLSGGLGSGDFWELFTVGAVDGTGMGVGKHLAGIKQGIGEQR